MVLAAGPEQRRFFRCATTVHPGAAQPVDTTIASESGNVSMSTTAKSNGTVKVLGIVTVIAGLIMVIAGGITWGVVTSNLSAERITVAEDAANFAGQPVNSPWTAFAQADIINHHALGISEGKTYAELDREDPVRETMMNASFLRASLFTSVVAFGVAFFAFGVGIVSIIVGWALLKLSKPAEVGAPASSASQSAAV